MKKTNCIKGRIKALIILVAACFSFVLMFVSSFSVHAAASPVASLTNKNMYDNRTNHTYSNWNWDCLGSSNVASTYVEYGKYNSDTDDNSIEIYYTFPTATKLDRVVVKGTCGWVGSSEESYKWYARVGVAYKEASSDYIGYTDYFDQSTKTFSISDSVYSKVNGKAIKNVHITLYIDSDGDFDKVRVSNFSIDIYPSQAEVTIAKGTGVKSVYLSTTQTATSGSASGTAFEGGATVYGFAELAKGYKAQNNWTLVSGTANTEGAKYRVGSVSAGSQNFGTVNAAIQTFNITYDLNDGTVSGTNPTSYNVNTNTFTLINPTRTGFTFKGWSGTDLEGDENTTV